MFSLLKVALFTGAMILGALSVAKAETTFIVKGKESTKFEAMRELLASNNQAVVKKCTDVVLDQTRGTIRNKQLLQGPSAQRPRAFSTKEIKMKYLLILLLATSALADDAPTKKKMCKARCDKEFPYNKEAHPLNIYNYFRLQCLKSCPND